MSKQNWGKRKRDGQAYVKGDGSVPISGGSIDVISPPTMKTKSQAIVEQSMVRGVSQRGDEIRKAQHNLEQDRKHHLMVMAVLPSFEETVHKEGFEVSEIYPSKTGMSGDWAEGDYMRVDVTLVPTSKKVKFIADRGYDSHGRNKNYKQLQTRASELKMAIEKGIGPHGMVSINQNSFEDSGEGKNRVLASFWVKANEGGKER